MRARVLEALRQPASAAELARRLEMPRQKVNYHLRALEDQGLVELVEEKRRGNCVERVVRATAKSYLVGAEALGALAASPGGAVDRFSSAYAVAAAARMVRDVAVLRDRAEAAGLELPTLTLEVDVGFASPKQRHAFAEALANAVARVVAEHSDGSDKARRYRLLVGMHPSMAAPTEGSKPAASYPLVTSLTAVPAARRQRPKTHSSSAPKNERDDRGETR